MSHHRNKELSATGMQELPLLLKVALSATDVKRVQCIYFRGKGLSAEAIGELVRYSVGHMKRVGPFTQAEQTREAQRQAALRDPNEGI